MNRAATIVLVLFARAAHAQEAPAAEPSELTFTPWDSSRLALELEIYTQARHILRGGSDLSELRLDRGEVAARVGVTPWAAADVRLEAIRSATEGGAAPGIDGNSMVVRVKHAYAAAATSFGEWRLEGAMGFVPDPWIATLETDYAVKPLSRTGSERLLDWPTSDLAIGGRASYRFVRAALAFANGEGLRYPELNDGKTITGVVEVVAVATDALRVSVTAMGRDGSLGIARTRERRAGGAIAVTTPRARAGAELVAAWGIGGDGVVEGLLVGGWAEARVAPWTFLAARGASLGVMTGAAGRLSTFGGALAVEAWSEAAPRRGRLRLWLAIDRVTASGSATPLPGAGDATVLMLIASAIAPFRLD